MAVRCVLVGMPSAGRPADQVVAALQETRHGDADWRHGRTFSLIYNSGDAELEALLERVAADFAHDNALNPVAFPSLRRLEKDVVAASAELLGGRPDAGCMTSGGTESILMAVKVARDVGRRGGVENPNIVVPATAHPAFAKAAHTLGIDERRVPVGEDLRADVTAMEAAVDEATALVVGSAPCYPFGVVDDIGSLAALAAARGTLCHVDACLGGWLLPFMVELGRPIPPFDFAVDGVTSMSADVHKFGYSTKGASTVLYRDRDLLRDQHFVFDGWPGGRYGSPAAAGARPGAPIATAWAAVHHLGRSGYLRLAQRVLDAFDAFTAGIDAIDGLAVTGEPDFPSFQFSSTDPAIDVAGVADVMDDRDWHLDRQQGGLHLMLSPHHASVAEPFLADLREAAACAAPSRGRAATYGDTG